MSQQTQEEKKEKSSSLDGNASKNTDQLKQSLGAGPGERQHSPFSPHQSHSVMNNFFSKKGPIKPPTQTDPAQAIAIQNMIIQTAKQQQKLGSRAQYGYQNDEDEDYYDEEIDYRAQRGHMNQQHRSRRPNDDYDEQSIGDVDGEGGSSADGSAQKDGNTRQLSLEEQELILRELIFSAQDNREFMKVLHILQNDAELRPLIFEHEALLRTLKEMNELKAEQMLSILTAAETEMYESSKKNEELNQQNKLMMAKQKVPTENKSVAADILSLDIFTKIQKENDALKQQQKILEKELLDQSQLFQQDKRKLENIIEEKKNQLKQINEQMKQLKAELERGNQKISLKKDNSDSKIVNDLQEQLKKAEYENSQLKQKIDKQQKEQLSQKNEKQLKEQIDKSQDEQLKLNRKLEDLYKFMLIQDSDEREFKQSNLDGSRLFIKADFSFVSPRAMKLNHEVNKQDHSEYKVIQRPRRKSIDCLQNQNTSFQKFINDESNDQKQSQKWMLFNNIISIDKLQNELIDKKLHNDYLQKQILKFQESQFNSQAKGDQVSSKINQDLVTFEQQEQQEKLETWTNEVSQNLLIILRKLTQDSVLKEKQWRKDKNPVNNLREIIFEISSRCDELIIELKSKNRDYQSSYRHQTRSPSQESYDISQLQKGSNISQLAQSQSKFHFHSQIQGHTKEDIEGGITLNNYASTADFSIVLDEREKRLNSKEELMNCKEQILSLQRINDGLKREISQERSLKQNSFAMAQVDRNQEFADKLNREYQAIQKRLEVLQDENITLKLRISDLEGELIDEKKQKQVKQEFIIESLKNQVQEQYFDQKLKFEEQVMNQKEINYKLKVDLQGYQERNQILKDQILVFRDRVTELEKETLVQSKENYILNSELDYHQQRGVQLEKKNEKLTSTSQISQWAENKNKDNLISEQQKKILDLEFDIKQLKMKGDDNIRRELEKVEIDKLRFDNEQLRFENIRLKLQKPEIENQVIQRQDSKAAIMNANRIKKSNAVTLMKVIKNGQQQKQAFQAFIKMLKYQQEAKYIQLQIQSKQKGKNPILDSQNEDTESKMELQDEIFKLQQIQTDLVKILGKTVRASNSEKPLKLLLSKQISKQSLGFLLSGLKGNYKVQELHISDCQLDDEDLERISVRLIEDRGIKILKIGQNQFTNSSPIIQLLKAKQGQYRSLDISSCPIGQQAINEGISETLGQMRALEDINLSDCFSDDKNQKVGNITQSIVNGCTNLRSINISKNAISKDSLIKFLSLLSQRGAHTIESLQIASIKIEQESHQQLLQTVSTLRCLRKLDISENNNLGIKTVQQILKGLIHIAKIEDLDISQTGINNDNQTMQLIGELIKTNKNLRALGLQRLNLTDQTISNIIEPLCQSLNIEAINLNFNQLDSGFVQTLVNKLIQAKPLIKSKSQGQNSAESLSYKSSIMTDETGGNEDEIMTSLNKRGSHPVSNQSQSKNVGLVSLSFEGNQKLGDRGASAFATLIQTQTQFSNNLKIINLNECGITNSGFEQLKQALLLRANLANSLNLTHVKITIERNNIESLE